MSRIVLGRTAATLSLAPTLLRPCVRPPGPPVSTFSHVRTRTYATTPRPPRPRTAPRNDAGPASTGSNPTGSSTGPSSGPRRPPPRPPRPASTRDEPPANTGPPPDPLTLRNGDIPFRMVQLVDPETETLGASRSLSSILETFDESTHALICVQTTPPIVKLVNLEDEKRKAREIAARVKLARRTAIEEKEVQVGWHAATGDLEHKIGTARALLEKGDRVHVVFATRAGGGRGSKIRVSVERKAEIVAMFDEALSEVATKWKDDERERGLWICWWTPLPSIYEQVKNKILTAEVDKRRVRDEKKEARRLKEEERARKAKERQQAQFAKAP